MNERTLSRNLSTALVDALKAHGHILVAKGGVEALVRELDELMAESLARIAPRLGPRTVVGEVTSTFGDENVDEAVEEMVGGVTRALMDSDHVEDVFSEDHVIRRDVFRVVRDALLAAPLHEEEAPEPAPISVRLETLGYVASTVAKRADAETLRDALERAADVANGELSAYDASDREATFSLHDGDPDARLELEEAVADELANLVDIGLVDLPTIERTIPLGRDVTPVERPLLKPRIEAVAARTLRRGGTAATWELKLPRAMLVTFTPLAEHDVLDADARVAAFDAELRAILEPPPAEAPAPEARPLPAVGPRPPVVPEAPAEPVKKAAPKKAVVARAPAKAATPAKKAAPAKKPAAAKAPAKKAAAAKPAAVKKPAAKKAAPVKKAPAKAAKPAKKLVAKKPAAKKAPVKKAASKKAAAKKR